ncbi:alpha/beta fold hydrolase [Henriciella barbarensis]|uniref:Alpha/beta fold hydrolase n=1 Tax=Henriciella barbarensis TaxID=86342 RepID=A0A399QPN2_9PROT|nr:haloalkane dehalogenase [Henriciella barbarensis]RIJ20808.1 alpha/beta fold hydrolase [Henriciella barbarensis]
MNDSSASPSKGLARTPEARFDCLDEYPFQSHYVEIPDLEFGSIRQHYLDEGPKNGPLVLLLHGEPTWSYLYRHMIPILAEAGCRVIAPDLIGFGKSDKPLYPRDFSYGQMVLWLMRFLERLELKRITMFCQDWGGLLGLRLAAVQPERFDRIIASNTALPDGSRPMPDQFRKWRRFSRWSPVFPIGKIVTRGTARGISEQAAAAYDAPFPGIKWKAGARRLPSLVPLSHKDQALADNQKAWSALKRFDKPFLTLFGDSDPITAGWDKIFQDRIPGARNMPHETLPNTGHFCQEDSGHLLAEKALAFIRSTSGSGQVRQAN